MNEKWKKAIMICFVLFVSFLVLAPEIVKSTIFIVGNTPYNDRSFTIYETDPNQVSFELVGTLAVPVGSKVVAEYDYYVDVNGVSYVTTQFYAQP